MLPKLSPSFSLIKVTKLEILVLISSNLIPASSRYFSTSFLKFFSDLTNAEKIFPISKLTKYPKTLSLKSLKNVPILSKENEFIVLSLSMNSINLSRPPLKYFPILLNVSENADLNLLIFF